MRFPNWFFSLLLLIPAAPGMAGITVNQAQEADFDRFTSFAWVVDSAMADSESEPSIREAEEMIHAAISRELTNRGLREVTEEPHLLVRWSFVVREEERDDVDILEEDARWGSSATRAGQPGEYTREIDMGTLVVDLLDGYSKLQIWRATATAVVRPKANKRSEKRINKVVGKMFESYPVQ